MVAEKHAVAEERQAAPPAGKQVFISYSHEPRENSEFVRNLAGRLTTAGFSVWLDEEQITGDVQEEIQAAARASEAAIFVVTERWAKRSWTRHEVMLFGERIERRDGVRLIVLAREEIDYGYLGPYLSPLLRIDWLPNDDEPDARFWQVYCGIRKERPGERKYWAEKGRALTVGVPPESQPIPPSYAAVGKTTALPIKGRPVDIVSTDDKVFVGSDLDEWLAIGLDRIGAPASRLSRAVAHLGDSAQGLIVATCDPMVAHMTEGGWDYWSLPAPALALCAGSEVLYAGTTTGLIVSMKDGAVAPICQLREPAIALSPVDDGLVALGAQGLLGRVALAGADRGALTWLESGNIGRPVGLFSAVESEQIGLIGATRIGVIDPASKRVTECSKKWEQGIQDVLFLGPHRWPYAVLTDGGELWFVSSALDGVKAAPLPASAVVVGVCGAPGQNLAAVWTREGRLYRINSVDRPAECLVEGGVVIAARMGGRSAILTIQWDETAGASIRMVDA
jgi:hypothetical protein